MLGSLLMNFPNHYSLSFYYLNSTRNTDPSTSMVVHFDEDLGMPSTKITDSGPIATSGRPNHQNVVTNGMFSASNRPDFALRSIYYIIHICPRIWKFFVRPHGPNFNTFHLSGFLRDSPRNSLLIRIISF